LLLEDSQRHFRCHPLLLCPRDCSRGVVTKFLFRRERESGDGAPGGLPLNCRFSDAIGVFNSTSRWRTHVLVILPPARMLKSQDHALSFPGYVFGAPPFRIEPELYTSAYRTGLLRSVPAGDSLKALNHISFGGLPTSTALRGCFATNPPYITIRTEK
jgi:hypothetical protein